MDPKPLLVDVKVEKHPLPEMPDRTRIVGRLPEPDGRRISQWGETEESAREGMARFARLPEVAP